jgi:drug/metabolite transporter (DMT)-like permease
MRKGNIIVAWFAIARKSRPGMLVFAAILTSLTFSLYLKGAQMIGGPKASVLSCAEPLSSALLSVLLLGVSFAVPDWIGTLLILSSVVLISLDSRRHARLS